MRSLLVFVCVATIACWISRWQSSGPATSATIAPEWVRTVDGWERRGVVDARPVAQLPEVHPALVAALQLSASLIALLWWPSAAKPALVGAAVSDSRASRRRSESPRRESVPFQAAQASRRCNRC